MKQAGKRMTYERWEELLRKAWIDGIRLEPHPVSRDLCLATSATNPNGRYVVGVYACNCPARGECKHRALYLFEHPWLLPLVVEPIAVERDEQDAVVVVVA